MNSFRKAFLVVALFSILFTIFSCDTAERDPDQVIFLLEQEVSKFDPRKLYGNVYLSKVNTLIYSSLYTRDVYGNDEEPDLAAEDGLTIEDDLTFTVDIRQDVVFHDGEPLTADDVVFTYSSVLDPENDELKNPGLMEIIDSVSKVSDYKVRFTLKEVYAPFKSLLIMGIIPEHNQQFYSRIITADDDIIGTGPYKFEILGENNTYIELSANPDYFKSPPVNKKLRFNIVSDANNRISQIQKGLADIVQNNIPFEYIDMLENDENLHINSGRSHLYTYLCLNFNNEYLRDRRVRQAIAYSIDRQQIIERKFYGHARPSCGLLPPEHWAYFCSDDMQYNYDPDKAKQLLDDAGYSDPDGDGPDSRFSIRLHCSQDQFRRELAEQYKSYLELVGIHVDIRYTDLKVLLSTLIPQQNFDMYSLQWIDVFDPDLYYYFFHSSQIPTEEEDYLLNRAGYINNDNDDNPDENLDQLLELGRITLDKDARIVIYKQVQQILARDLPMISLWNEDNIAILNNRVQGYDNILPSARFTPIKDVRIIEEETR